MIDQSILTVVYNYCSLHGLPLLLKDELVKYHGGKEEWEGIFAAGLADGHDMAPAVIMLKDDGSISVVVGWSDGRQRMEDVWRAVTLDALKTGERLHLR